MRQNKMELKEEFGAYIKGSNSMKQMQPKHTHYYGSNAQKACKEKSMPTKTSNPPLKVNQLN
jgi:hypothetical protein